MLINLQVPVVKKYLNIHFMVKTCESWFPPSLNIDRVTVSFGKVEHFWLLCILTSFWVLRATKSWSNYFFSRFQTFLFILNLFQWFHGWNQQKTSENEKKWGGTSKLSFLVDFLLFFLVFCKFLTEFTWNS